MQLSVEKALVAWLRADSTIAGYVDTRIYNKLAIDPAPPYIVFSLNAGGDTNQQKRDQYDLRYTIKAVMVENGLLAAQIAQALYVRLHEQTFAVDTPLRIYRVQRLQIVDYVEQTERKQIYHNGGIYRIRVSGT